MARKFIELKIGGMAKAFNDEPTFVLLARDITAPATIREWCRLRCLHGKNTPQDAQIKEALQMAEMMESEQAEWQQRGRPLGDGSHFGMVLPACRIANQGADEGDRAGGAGGSGYSWNG